MFKHITFLLDLFADEVMDEAELSHYLLNYYIPCSPKF